MSRAHRAFIRAQRKKYPYMEYTGNVWPICEHCFCTGNTTCGHKPLGADCVLDESMICGCCQVESEPMTDTEHDEMISQEVLGL